MSFTHPEPALTFVLDVLFADAVTEAQVQELVAAIAQIEPSAPGTVMGRMQDVLVTVAPWQPDSAWLHQLPQVHPMYCKTGEGEALWTSYRDTTRSVLRCRVSVGDAAMLPQARNAVTEMAAHASRTAGALCVVDLETAVTFPALAFADAADQLLTQIGHAGRLWAPVWIVPEGEDRFTACTIGLSRLGHAELQCQGHGSYVKQALQELNVYVHLVLTQGTALQPGDEIAGLSGNLTVEAQPYVMDDREAALCLV